MTPIRSISPEVGSKPLFLTFDDGPEPGSTEKVIDLLSAYEMKATFFVIATKARKEHSLLKKIQSEGHSIGNHSLDHGYRPFFSGIQKMRSWVSDSEKILSDLTGAPTVGFRPPAGVQTPELHRVLQELSIPLVLWNIRFYDTVFRWSSERALRSLTRTKPGSIVLLHDRQAPDKLPLFLKTFSEYCERIRNLELVTRALSRELLVTEQIHNGN